jgi:hypothetical protein
VMVKTRQPITRATEHFVRHTVLQVSSRFGSEIAFRIGFEPPSLPMRFFGS